MLLAMLIFSHYHVNVQTPLYGFSMVPQMVLADGPFIQPHKRSSWVICGLVEVDYIIHISTLCPGIHGVSVALN